MLDGDDYRKTLCSDLNFGKEDRILNIRRLSIIANLLVKHKIIVIMAVINPYDFLRKEVKKKCNSLLVWVNCSLEVLIKRDPKELYKRALLDDSHPEKLFNLSGVNDLYEQPNDPDLIIDTTFETLEQSSRKLIDFILNFIYQM